MIAREASGPRRTEYLREIRIVAVVALLALAAGVLSDVLAPIFWTHHALLAGLASSMIRLVLTVAVVNKGLERRKRQRWSVLAVRGRRLA